MGLDAFNLSKKKRGGGGGGGGGGGLGRVALDAYRCR